MEEIEIMQEELSESICKLADSVKILAESQKDMMHSVEELKKNSANPPQSPLSPDIKYYR